MRDELLMQVGCEQWTALVELLVGLRECQFAVDDFGADGVEDLPQFCLGPGGAEEPGRGAAGATGLLRRTLAAIGREIQSRAFLSAPGTDALYSGVANRTASAPAI